jgi:hypothetical protein
MSMEGTKVMPACRTTMGMATMGDGLVGHGR